MEVYEVTGAGPRFGHVLQAAAARGLTRLSGAIPRSNSFVKRLNKLEPAMVRWFRRRRTWRRQVAPIL